MITVMCDYCAWGLWLDGYAIDLKGLAEKYGLEFTKKLEILDQKIEKWQEQYEEFELYDPKFDLGNFYQSDVFKDFMETGWEITGEIRTLFPGEVEYFIEDTAERVSL